MAKLGGISASFMPILGQFTPFFVLYFLLEVTRVIKDTIKIKYETRLKNYLQKCSD